MASTGRAAVTPDEYLGALKERAGGDQRSPVRIDLSPLTAMSFADASLVANGLIGALGDVALEVDPVQREDLPHLARTGVCFALANRAGATNVPSRELMHLDDWRESWAPGSQQPLHQLFSTAELNETEYEPRLFSPYHAAFVQPHLAASVGGSEVTRVLRPWLLRLIRVQIPDRRHAASRSC